MLILLDKKTVILDEMRKKQIKIRATSLLGQSIDKNRNYVIIGAGIAGLLCGFYLKKIGISFKIIEKNSSAGGVLGTKITPHGIAEQAANGFLWSAALQEVCDDLGLEIITPKKEAKARYFVRRKKLRQYPFSIWETLGIGRRMFTPHRAPIHTMEDFGQAYFGDTFTRQLLEPAMGGIYGASLEAMSFPAVLGELSTHIETHPFLPKALRKWRNERKKNTLEKPKTARGTHSFKGGMQALIDALAGHLKEHIQYDTEATEKDIQNTDNQYIITSPAHAISYFFDDEMNDLLALINYMPMISTTLFFNKNDLKKFKEGFGCLIPRNEGLTILGVLFNSCIFEQRVADESMVSLTCIMRDDSPTLSLIHGADIDIKNLVVNELDTLFDIQGELLDYAIFRWEEGIPVYSPQLHENLFKIDNILREKYSHINLFGNYTGRISIRQMSEEVRRWTANGRR